MSLNDLIPSMMPMKRPLFYFLLSLFLLLFSTACSTQESVPSPSEPITLPSEGFREITVTAEITRVALSEDRMHLQWSEGDLFGLFTDAGDMNLHPEAPYSEGANGFKLRVSEAATTLYAYYPYDEKSEATSETFPISLPSRQVQRIAGELTSINASGVGQYPLLAVGSIAANSNEVALSFRPVACALALNIYGPHAAGEQILSATFTPNGGICNCGVQTVDWSMLSEEFCYTATDGTCGPVVVTLEEPFTPDFEKPEDKISAPKQLYLTVARQNYLYGGTFVVTTTHASYCFQTSSPIDCSTTDFYALNLNLSKGTLLRTATLSNAEIGEIFQRAPWYGKPTSSYNAFAYTNEAGTWSGEVQISDTKDAPYLGITSTSARRLKLPDFHGEILSLAIDCRSNTSTRRRFCIYSEAESERGGWESDPILTEDRQVLHLDLSNHHLSTAYVAASGLSRIYAVTVTWLPSSEPLMHCLTSSLTFSSSVGDCQSAQFKLINLPTETISITLPEWLSWEWEDSRLLLTTSSENRLSATRSGRVTLSATGVEPVSFDVIQQGGSENGFYTLASEADGALEDLSGTYLFIGEREGRYYGCPAYSEGYNIKGVELLVTSQGVAAEVVEEALCAMTLTRISEDEYAGLYTIQDANGLYLTSTGANSSNQLKGELTPSKASYWDIDIAASGEATLVATKSNGSRNDFRFYKSSTLFSCYQQGNTIHPKVFFYKK